MPVKFGSDDSLLKVWLLLYQAYNSIGKCEDRVFSKHGITTEQHNVLMAIKHIDGPVTPTEVGRWLGQGTNSVTMIVHRMVKAGLVKRIRDLHDRRSVRLVITSRGKEILDRATVAGWTLDRPSAARMAIFARRAMLWGVLWARIQASRVRRCSRDIGRGLIDFGIS